ncbi:hypothetical protein VNI00_006525 [Paramarasmius palmivorus]|uniref:O-methyltransferase domain-containing protein n=1 Tax=Paramarasmius palmivorus TaxID=297713 RepID=A0AAW0D9B6_9AGAR
MAANTVLDNSHITALTALISSSVQEVIATYASVGRAVPSLDSAEPGPFDEIVEDTPERLVRAVKTIEAACAQLVSTVGNPSGIIYDRANTHAEPSCLLVALNARIADLLVDKPEGASVIELAEASGFKDADKLGRVMRLLATRHVFREGQLQCVIYGHFEILARTTVKPNIYANNRLSVRLISTNSVSDLVGLVTEAGLLASSHLNETYTTEPRVPNETPFQRATGHAFFDWHRLPENNAKVEVCRILFEVFGLSERGAQRFDRAMVAWSHVYGMGFLSKAYPWSTYVLGCTICDIGGGNGHVMMDLSKKNPHFKVVLQDQPGVIVRAKEYWTKEYPCAINEKRVEFVPFDFFKDAAAEGCDIYYLKGILHDWIDADCSKILGNVRKAMKPGAKLLIQEIVIRSIARPHNTQLGGLAPEPLLPNWGASAARSYEEDIAMMRLHNAKERTLEEFISLCEPCGLRFNKSYPAGDMDLVEFVTV